MAFGAAIQALLFMLPVFLFALITAMIIVFSTKRGSFGTRINYALLALVAPFTVILFSLMVLPHNTPEWIWISVLLFSAFCTYLALANFFKYPPFAHNGLNLVESDQVGFQIQPGPERMKKQEIEALLYGLAAGGLVLTAGAVWFFYEEDQWLIDIMAYGLPIVLAPIAAIASATAMRATVMWSMVLALLAFLIMVGIVSLIDYFIVLWMMFPRESIEAGVPAEDTWMLVHHIVSSFLGLFSGVAFGVVGARKKTNA